MSGKFSISFQARDYLKHKPNKVNAMMEIFVCRAIIGA
jgi:hypothetical protein